MDLPPELHDVDQRLIVPPIKPPVPLIYKEGWRNYVNSQPVPRPPVLRFGTVQKWTEDHQNRYAAIRRRYHASLPTLSTPDFTSITDLVVRLALSGIDMRPGVRPGAVLNGYPTLGKSTILVEIGRKYERTLRKRMDRSDDEGFDDEFIPVVYVTLAGRETTKSLFIKILDFLGAYYSSGDSEAALNTRVAKGLRKAGTSLVLIDDIHFLNVHDKNGKLVNEQLKALGSSSNATFCYAGVDVETTGLLYDGGERHSAEAAQTQARFKKLDLVPFKRNDPAFAALLSGLEKQLCLLKAVEGDLVGLVAYVHDRAGGLMGPTTALVREGAAAAISSKTERITKAVLEAVILDHASEVRSKSLVGTCEESAS